MLCRNCGTSATNKRFCTQCGVELQKGQTQATPTATSAGSHGTKKTAAGTEKLQFLDALIGQTIDHRYHIESMLGLGAMGAVYRAKRLNIGDTAAVKILKPEYITDQLAIERFHREAQVGARLRHPNAVRVYDFGVSEDMLIYFVMELVEGRNLREVIIQTGQLSQTAAADIIVQICSALEEAHRQDVVHRDLKPENIVVQATAAGYSVKVLDFGIASLCNLPADKLSQTNSVVGTPHYMSPEQCLGEAVDQRSDIYSLGIILYEMLAGMPPFKSTTPGAIRKKQIYQKPQPLRELNPRVSPGVEAVVMRALEKQPGARPQTAAALAQELLAAIRSEQPKLSKQKAVVEKAPEIPPAVAVKAARKSNRFARASISLLLLLAGVASFGHGWSKKNNGDKLQPMAFAETTKELTTGLLPQANDRSTLNPEAPGEKPETTLEAPQSNTGNSTDPGAGKPIEKTVPKLKTGPSLPSTPKVKSGRGVTQKQNANNRKSLLNNEATREKVSQDDIRPRRMFFRNDDRYRSSFDSIPPYYRGFDRGFGRALDRDGYWMRRRCRRNSQ